MYRFQKLDIFWGANSITLLKLDESELQTSQLNKIKVSLETQLADAIRLAEDEAKERLQLMSKFRSVERDVLIDFMTKKVIHDIETDA